MGSYVEELASSCADLKFEDLDEETIETAKAKLLDALTCAILGRATAVSQHVRRTTKTAEDGAWISSSRVGEEVATFANAVDVHALLHDDVDLATGHPGCVVVPSALAVAEQRGSNGKEILLAIVAGYEAMWRIGGCGDFLMKATARGFRGNTLLGGFGSTTAAARLLKFDAPQTSAALGITASLVAGLLQPLNEGSMERSIQQASNSRDGILAARLAQSGLEASRLAIEGSEGLYATFAGSSAPDLSLASYTSDSWRIRDAFAKPYPSAGSNTVGIAVAEHLRQEAKLDPATIDQVIVSVLPRFTGNPGYSSIAYKGPFTTLEQTLISFPFQMACMLEYGTVDFNTLRDHVTDPRLFQLANQIELKGVEVPHPLWCKVEVSSSDGAAFEAVSDEINWNRFYLSFGEAADKFLEAATEILPDPRIEQVIELIRNIEDNDAVSLVQALSPKD